MNTLSLSKLSPDLLPAARFASTALHALAREEQAGRRTRRLLEPEQQTWRAFRGRMDAIDLLDLLLEDAAVTQPFGFDVQRILAGQAAIRSLPPKRVQSWIDALPELELSVEARDYFGLQAQQLGLVSQLARSDLHRGIQAHQRVLELPGTGGQLSGYLAGQLEGVYLQDGVFRIAWQGWEDRMLAGLVAVEHGLSGEAPIYEQPGIDQAQAEDFRFDYVIGARPEREVHAYDLPELEQRFPGATIVLV